MNLEKNHNPLQNAKMIAGFFKEAPSIQTAVAETENLFLQLADHEQGAAAKSSWQSWIKSLWTKKKEAMRLYRTVVTEKQIYPEWKKQLDKEWQVLKQNTQKTIYVTPKDDLQAALKSGNKTVILSEGVYFTDELRIFSYTRLIGAGPGKTILKLRSTAPKRSFVLTNKNHVKGNHHILIEGITLDWSIERLKPDEKSSSGNNRSSCLTLAHVTYGWVKNCQALNAGLHGFDVSSTLYDYSGDGHRARGGSRFIWIDKCTASGFGDDGVTTHHSDFVFISNCFMHDPSGRSHKKGMSNSNGFEADDGSRYIWLVNNASARCFGGVEAKAHATSSAAAHVHIIGHLSVHDNRSFNFRHIGHHSASDPDSKTARFLTATRLVSIEPVHTPLYPSSKPRVLTVSAYQYVVINGLKGIGNPCYDYHGHPVAGIQFKARHIHLQNISMKSFVTAGAAIKIFGGANRARHVTLQGAHFVNCGPQPLAVAKDAPAAAVKSITII